MFSQITQPVIAYTWYPFTSRFNLLMGKLIGKIKFTGNC